jgi:hypothetical protein
MGERLVSPAIAQSSVKNVHHEHLVLQLGKGESLGRSTWLSPCFGITTQDALAHTSEREGFALLENRENPPLKGLLLVLCPMQTSPLLPSTPAIHKSRSASRQIPQRSIKSASNSSFPLLFSLFLTSCVHFQPP